MHADPHGRRAGTLLLGLALALLAGTAAAQPADPRQPVALTVAGPADVPLGNLARVVAELRDPAGSPIGGARIVFVSPATFAGAVGEMEIGEATTDADGAATLDYQLRIQGPNQVTARFLGDETRQPAQASAVMLATGTAQLVQRTAGIAFPVWGPWALVPVLGVVWTVYFASLLLVAGIPERRRPPTTPQGGRA